MSKKYVVIGLGSSGLSAARYLCEQGHAVAVTDTQSEPALAAKLPAEAGRHFGAIDQAILLSADTIVISPGIDPRIPAIQSAKAAGIPVISDVQLFIDALRMRDTNSGTQTPIVAITGSNAKSTVTTLVGEMAEHAGICTGVGGNIGTPALELLKIKDMALAILELSSFQLEHISQLSAKVATILNISADHLDRHEGMEDYLNQKLRIFQGCEAAVICQDDPQLSRVCQAALPSDAQIIHTDSSLKPNDEFHLYDAGDGLALYYGHDKLMDTQKLKIKGKHNLLNALSALALGMAAQIDMSSMLQALQAFKGLPHRCEYVDEIAGKAYFNDSKGTNIGSTLAAIDGLGTVYGKQSMALILGGLSKGQDFSEMSKQVSHWVGVVYLIGQDAKLIEQGLLAGDPQLSKIINTVTTLDAAVAHASQSDVKVVLLSPACASMDQFKNYSQRGDHFVKLVQALA